VNIIIAVPTLVYPTVPHGGGQDLIALIRFLGQRHAVRLVAYVDERQAAHAAELKPYLTELRLVYPAVTLRARWHNALATLRRGQWQSLGRRARLELQETITGWASAGLADVVICGWTWMGCYLSAAPPATLRVLDEVDVRFIVELGEAGQRPLARLRALRRRATELSYCRAAHLVLTRSARDLDVLRAAVPGLRGRVLPPVAHSAALLAQPAAPLGEPGRVLFVGAMDRRRNQQAARWLADAIWPSVHAQHPTAQLRLVGANPEALADLAARPGVEVTGWVPDLPAEYSSARVVVAPMRSEAGALNKVMDALSAGRPVVATASANAGIGAPPEAICLAEDVAGFARAISQLLASDPDAECLGQAARRFAERTFDWPTAAAAVEAEMVELVGRLRGSA
jgi:polysaccharide biosynthesis protein PslH